MLEHILKLEHSISMPHHKIHKVLKEHNLSRREPKKGRRRKLSRSGNH